MIEWGDLMGSRGVSPVFFGLDVLCRIQMLGQPLRKNPDYVQLKSN